MLSEEKQIELQKTADYGRKAKTAIEFIKEFVLSERAQIIIKLETQVFENNEEILTQILYLRMLRKFENEAEKYIAMGEIAEKEMMREDGSE